MSLNLGDHASLVFDDEEERRAFASCFVSEGLARGERVIYVLGERKVDALLADVVRSTGRLGERAVASGQLLIRSADNGASDTELSGTELASDLRTELSRVKADGFPGLRLTMEMGWSRCVDRLVGFERTLHDVLNGGPVATVCQYDRHRFSAAALGKVAGVHPIQVVSTHQGLIRAGMILVDDLHDPPGIALAGELDTATAPVVEKRLGSCSGQTIHIDLRRLSFCSASGARALVGPCTEGRRVVLISPQPPVHRVLDFMGLERISGLEIST